ncbi:MAG: winged helix-turn-helix transcriptional regulator [Candidatus Heimdallarchaeota archaeon]|nr:winged helix-turn-helix transcriptional regulator [Candidatus Heimdallarchaeota archaeon]
MSNISTSFKSISHPIRVQILLMLAERINAGYNFSELSRELQIESSGKLAFHLEKMEDLIMQSDSGRYNLTDKGKKAVQAVQILGVQSNDNEGLTSNAKVLMKGNRDINQDAPLTISNSKGLHLRDFILLGFLFEIFLIYLLPIGFGLILSSLSENPNTLGMVYLVFTSIGAFSYGIIIPKIADKRGSDEVNTDFGLVLLLLGTWSLLLLLPIIGAISSFGYIAILLFSSYPFIITGAWLSLKLLNYETDNRVFPLEFYKSKSKYMVTGIVVAFIPFYSRQITITEHPSEFETLTYSFTVTSSVIGVTGFTTMLFITFIVLIFRNFNIINRIVTGLGKYVILVGFAIYSLQLNLSDPTFQQIYDDGTGGRQWLIIILLKSLSIIVGGLVGFRVVESHLPNRMKKKIKL